MIVLFYRLFFANGVELHQICRLAHQTTLAVRTATIRQSAEPVFPRPGKRGGATPDKQRLERQQRRSTNGILTFR